MAQIKSGSRVRLVSSRGSATVQHLIGEGSQGTVHHATVDGTDRAFALKWYVPSPHGELQRANIEDLIERGAPDGRFLWPTELVHADDTPGFGYAMALRPGTAVGLAQLLDGTVDVPFSVVCDLGMHLADAFLALHSQGLCYRDISFGNIFFDRSTGRPLICDNDNVGVDGAPSGVLGTRQFMAPEIVRGEASPSTATDLYSLSVLLFYLLMVGHPLVGRRELEFAVFDAEAAETLFGREPTFVFHPTDASNAALPGVHDAVLANWAIYPAEIRGLFTTAFTHGLHDPANGRVRESVWRAALARLRDRVTTCGACGKESFWFESSAGSCWSCHRPIPDPVRLVFGDRPVVLRPGTLLRPYHLGAGYDLSIVVGEVTAHPRTPGRWGICNRSDTSWAVSLPTGEQIDVAPGRSVGLVVDSVIELAGTRARVLA